MNKMLRYLYFAFLLSVFISCSKGNKKGAESDHGDNVFTEETKKSFLNSWGEPTFSTPGEEGEVTLSYFIDANSGQFGKNVIGLTAHFKNDMLITVQPIVKVDTQKNIKTGEPALEAPEPDVLFEGKAGLEKYLEQIIVREGVQVLNKRDKKGLKELLIYSYDLSQSQGLHQECVIAMKGAFWELMNKNFKEIEKFTVDEGGEKKVDVKSLLEFWGK